jgi:tRNA(His) 5'-end guanylyltransferase
MKGYEAVSKDFLMKRTPVIIRLDGKAFHTYARNLPDTGVVPFSETMHTAMVAATVAAVKEAQGCVLGYTQSDEITLLLRDYDTLETQAWFGYNVQKIVSVIATATANAFNCAFRRNELRAPEDFAKFDARAFNIPKEEATNNFLWRQQDASRNSIQMLGHYHFSQKQMHAKNNSEVQDMLMLEKGVNWNDLPTWMKRGTCVVNDGDLRLAVDEEIPIFTQDRAYIDQHVYIDKVAA